MRSAYEGVDVGGETVGLITYMRTDGVQIASEAINAVRRVIDADYGARYVPHARRRYETKAKTRKRRTRRFARPILGPFRPGETNRFLDPDQAKLYD